MTRAGLSPRLSQHLAEPFLEIHPQDARELGLDAATLALVKSPQGQSVLRVLITDRVGIGQCFAATHWTGLAAPTGRIKALVAPITDTMSGQPESKATPVSITAYGAKWYGFAISRGEFRSDYGYWAPMVVVGGTCAELGGTNIPTDWESYARDMFQLPNAQVL